MKREIIDYIIIGLFRDDKWHELGEKAGGEFYIDIINEILADDIEFDRFLRRWSKNGASNADEFEGEFSRIAVPHIRDVKKKLEELEGNRWIKIEKTNLEVFGLGQEDKTAIGDEIIPAGQLLTHIIKITAKEVSWGKFIEHIQGEYEKSTLDWDNIYSRDKQESLVIESIDSRRKYLDKDADIIFLLDRSGSHLGCIQLLTTLGKLEQNDLVSIDGFRAYDPENRIDKITKQLANMKNSPLALKAKISVTQKFKEKIKTIEGERSKYLTTNKRGSRPGREDSRLSVVIDLQKGIYDAAHPDRIYEISGKRLKLIKYLCKNSVASLSDFAGHTGQDDALLVKEIKEINNNFRKCLELKNGLIVHSRTGGGYRLNKDNFEVKTPT